MRSVFHVHPVTKNLVAAVVLLAVVPSAAGQCPGIWSPVGESGPPPRQNHAMVYDSVRSVVVLFGGYRGGVGFYGDTWEWNGTEWTQTATDGPAARGNHAMAYDSVRRKTVLFGGAGDGGSYLGDTWEYDGATQSWSAISPATVPTAHYNAAMTFDSARNVSVLFGGYSGTREGDTWTWDGANWTQVATTGCTPRNGHAMAFDAARGVVVLFGGFNGSRLSDTWEWNGSAWAPRPTVGGPSGRQYLGVAYHSDRQRVMLFGGQTGACSTCREDDTWEWNGMAWVQLGDNQATLRDQHALAYDAARRELFLFGGYAGSGLVLEDSWIWRLQTLPADLNGDGAVGLADLTFFLSHFGTASGATAADGDLDGDTDVDLNDMTLFLASFGETC